MIRIPIDQHEARAALVVVEAAASARLDLGIANPQGWKDIGELGAAIARVRWAMARELGCRWAVADMRDAILPGERDWDPCPGERAPQRPVQDVLGMTIDQALLLVRACAAPWAELGSDERGVLDRFGLRLRVLLGIR